MIESHNIPKITKFKELVKFLNKNLKWPIEIENFDNEEVLSYNFDPSELGLEKKHCSKIIEIKQLRPFDDLPWAVFWVNFENKNLPISALRKILNKFVTKKSEKKDMLTWKSQDLLFVTGHGIRENRAITFARFYENEKSKYILREFWWDKHEIDYS